VKSSNSVMPVDFGKRWSSACFAMVLFAALNFCQCVDPAHSGTVGPARTLFGTRDTQVSSVGTEKRAGLSVAMFELDWANSESERGVFNTSYVTGIESILRKLRAEGRV
jgi:hypothetical protein